MIKVRGTRVGSDGTGYYQDNRGRQYYGNPQNGYIPDSLEQREKDRREWEAQAQEEEAKRRRMEERDAMRAAQRAAEHSPEAIQAQRDTELVAAGALGAMMALILYVAVCLLLLETVAITWPGLLEQLFWEYRWGQANLVTVFRTVNAAGLIALFVLDLRGVAQGQNCVKQYAVLAVVLTVVTGAAGDLVSGQFHLFDQIIHVFEGLQLAVLPALILYYKQFRREGGRRFFHCLAWRLCYHLPGCSKIFKILGTATCVFAVIGALVMRGNSPLSQIVLVFVVLMACGLIGLYIGRAGEE